MHSYNSLVGGYMVIFWLRESKGFIYSDTMIKEMALKSLVNSKRVFSTDLNAV